MNFTKLKDLQKFVIRKYIGYQFKKWDNEKKQMLTSDQYQEGYQKKYQFVVWNGKEELQIDLSEGQVGQILARAMKDDWLDGAKVEVGNNGKEGMEIRYYFNFHGIDQG